MIGNYLTTKGRKVEDDLEMIKDLNLELQTSCGNGNDLRKDAISN